MQERITGAEFEEWKQFYSVRPFGDEWDDMRFGNMTAELKASFGGVPDGMRHDKFIETCMPFICGRDNKWRGRLRPEEQAELLMAENQRLRNGGRA